MPTNVWMPYANALPGTSTNRGVKYGNGIYFALKSTVAQSAISADGVTWSAGGLSAGSYYNNTLEFGGGQFVAVSALGGTSGIYTSPDGVTWTPRTTPNLFYASIVYGGGTFVAGATGSTNKCAYSTDNGASWTQATVSATSDWMYSVYGAGTFLMWGNSTTATSSADGIAWATQTLPSTSLFAGAFGAGLFVLPKSGAAQAYTSPSGLTGTWTLRTLPVSASWSHISYVNGKFVLVGGTVVLTSTDGISWTQELYPVSDGVVSGDGASQFVALSGSTVVRREAVPTVPATSWGFSGDLWLHGQYKNYSAPGGLATTTYATPTMVVEGGVVQTRVTKDNLFYLNDSGELWSVGYKYAMGIGSSGHTSGAWTLVATGVDFIYDTDAYDGNIIYRKGTEYWVSGYIYPSINTSVGKTSSFATAPGRITSLSGMNIASFRGGSGECIAAIDTSGNVYMLIGSGGDQGGLAGTTWTSNGWMDDGLFHLVLTPTQWAPTSLVGNAFESAFMGIQQTPSGALHVSGDELDMFVGYPIPARNTVTTRPTSVGGAWGVMSNGMARTYSGLAQARLINYVNFFISDGLLCAHKGNQPLSGPFNADGVVWLGFIGGLQEAEQCAMVVGIRNGSIVLGNVGYYSSNPIVYVEALDLADYPEFDDTSFIHAAAYGYDVAPTYYSGLARALVILPAPPPIEFWENAVGVEQNV